MNVTLLVKNKKIKRQIEHEYEETILFITREENKGECSDKGECFVRALASYPEGLEGRS